jgi:ubiquinone/menaquinone biosynthesis C-methylase UbiE
MTKSPQQFYDALADSYSFIFPDWQASVKRQGKIISELIGKQPLSILDCSCGIGTQAIGLALEGYKVHATDISPKEIEQAEKAAVKMGAKLTFGVADFRTLDSQVQGEYDAVVSFDNSLPHLLTDDDLTKALDAMKTKLVQDGKLYISIRDYDSLLEEKPKATLPQITQTKDGERIYFQTWQWHENSPIYQTNLFILVLDSGSWKVNTSSTTYRALRKSELSDLLEKSGYKDIEWLEPSETGYYQPIVRATQ